MGTVLQMMLTRSSYLQQMGISIWRLRQTPIISCYYYQFFDDAGEHPVCLLLADAILNNPAEKELVQAISRAIANVLQKKYSEHFVEDAREVSKQAHFVHTRVMILLGERLRVLVSQGIGEQAVMISYSPAQLLIDTHLKADVWKEIKTAIGAYTSVNTR